MYNNPPLKLHTQHLGNPHTLPDAEVKHNLLGTARDSISPHITVQPLDLSTLPTARVGQAAENLRRLTGAELKRDGSLSLETGNGAAETKHSLSIAHLLTLVNHILQPVVRRLDLPRHVRQLEPDDGVLNQLLAKRPPLVGVLDRLLVADAGEAEALDDDADALVVEVGHDDAEALVLLADEVLDGDLDVLERDVGRARRPDALAVHPAGGDTAEVTLDEQEGNTVHAGAAGADGDGEVVAPDTVGDPLLLAVDDIMLAILGELSLAGEVGDVRTGVGLGDGQADALVAVEDAREDTVDDRLLAELDQGGAADAEATNDVPDEATGPNAGELVGEDHLVEEIPLLGGDRLDGVLDVVLLVVGAEETGEVAALAHLLVDVGGDLLLLVPFGDVGLDFGLYPLADFGAEGGVGLVEVGGVVLGYSVSCCHREPWHE